MELNDIYECTCILCKCFVKIIQPKPLGRWEVKNIYTLQTCTVYRKKHLRKLTIEELLNL